MAVTINTLREFKQKGEAFAALTSYDATFSQVVSEAGVHVILIGDSLGIDGNSHRILAFWVDGPGRAGVSALKC